MEGTTSFESADSLLILAFEEQLDIQSCRTTRLLLATGLPFISFCLRRACDSIDGFACCDWRTIDIGLDSSVSCLHRLSGERRAALVVGHSQRDEQKKRDLVVSQYAFESDVPPKSARG